MGGMLEDFWGNTVVSTGHRGGIRHLLKSSKGGRGYKELNANERRSLEY